MISKKTPDENLLDAQLNFIMNAPTEQFDAYLAESGTDLAELDRKTTVAFNRALENHAKTQIATEALANLTSSQQKVIAQNLGIRRQVFTAFREHRVEISSVPVRFLKHLSHELGQAVDALGKALLSPAPSALAGQHKSDAKPDASPKRMTFEQALREADMSEEEIKQLMREEDG